MVNDWRYKWRLQAEKYPFFFVQMQPYTGPGGESLPEMRASQQKIAQKLSFSGMATAIDLGQYRLRESVCLYVKDPHTCVRASEE